MKDLKKEFDEKIHNLFKDNDAYLEYLLQTKKNFLYRYLETSADKDIPIHHATEKSLTATSYENNMGEAFKISDPEIKEGIKSLAKSVSRELNPKVRYSLQTDIVDLKGESGKIEITAEVNWGYPDYQNNPESSKRKKIVFQFQDIAAFRKGLALKYEEACELFL